MYPQSYTTPISPVEPEEEYEGYGDTAQPAGKVMRVCMYVCMSVIIN